MRDLQGHIAVIKNNARIIRDRREFRALSKEAKSKLANGPVEDKNRLARLKMASKAKTDYHQLRESVSHVYRIDKHGFSNGAKGAISRYALQISEEFTEGSTLVTGIRSKDRKKALIDLTGANKRSKVYSVPVRKGEQITFKKRKGKTVIVLKNPYTTREFLPFNPIEVATNLNSEIERIVEKIIKLKSDFIFIGTGKYIWGGGTGDGNKIRKPRFTAGLTRLLNNWQVKYSIGNGHHSNLEDFLTGVWAVREVQNG